MKKYLVLLLILLSPILSYSQQNWTKVGVTDNSDVYIDFNTIKKVEKNMRVWVLYDFRQESQNGMFKFSSYTDYSEFDCSQDRYRTLQQTMYSGRMGNGSTKNVDFNTEKWTYIVPTTMNESILKLVCKSKK